MISEDFIARIAHKALYSAEHRAEGRKMSQASFERPVVADRCLSQGASIDPKQPLMYVYCHKMLLAFMEDSD